jgi:hypothetical protein
LLRSSAPASDRDLRKKFDPSRCFPEKSFPTGYGGGECAPSDDLDSAILVTLDPGAYTKIVRGVNGRTGIGLVEAYHLD